MRRWHKGRAAAALCWAGACVSYDPTGPHAAAIHGTFDAALVTVLSNDLEVRRDTSPVMLTLRDSLYRGRFRGLYRFSDGDSGEVAGTLFPDGRIELSHFGPWPPLTHVFFLWRLYPTCTFPSLGPIFVVNGNLRADTLRLAEVVSLPCSDRQSTFEFRLMGIRAP